MCTESVCKLQAASAKLIFSHSPLHASPTDWCTSRTNVSICGGVGAESRAIGDRVATDAVAHAGNAGDIEGGGLNS